MLQRRIYLILTILFFFSLLSAHQNPKAPSHNGLELVRSTKDELIIELRISDFQEEDIYQGGEIFQRIKAKGFGYVNQPGKPMLPFSGTLIEIPPGAKVKLEILDSEKSSKSDYHICPFPELEIQKKDGKIFTYENYIKDKDLYSSDIYFPQRIAELGFQGKLRDKNVVQLKFLPFQFNPRRGQLIVHTMILVKVKLVGGQFKEHEMVSPISYTKKDPFEPVYRSKILNYSQGKEKHIQNEGYFKKQDFNFLENAYKIKVADDGIYKLTYEDLTQAGVDLISLNPEKIDVYNRDKRISILICGEEDQVFDPEDYVIFYGTKNQSPYSDTNFYWLTWGAENGLRMGKKDVYPENTLPPLQSYLYRVHLEENDLYYANVWQGREKSHWFWISLLPPHFLQDTVDLNALVDTDGDFCFRIVLRGKTNDISVDPDHHVQISINGTPISDLFWDGKIEYDTTVYFTQAILREKENQVEIKSVSTGTIVNQFYIDYYEIGYWRRYQAAEDFLKFGVPESDSSSEDKFHCQIGKFTKPEIELFDISDPESTKYLIDFDSHFNGETHTIEFQDEFSKGKEYLALTRDKIKSPVSIVKDQPSDLLSTSNQADYIIITHPDFFQVVKPLEELRESEGLNVKVVKVTDVYDEFNYGIFDPSALKDFLFHAYFNWQPPQPTYVLLVGDASYDFKGYLGQNTNYVPTHLFIASDGNFSEIGSDSWLACVDGEDDLADLLIGRLSGQSVSDIENMVGKTIQYERLLPDQSWRKRILFVADNPDAGGDFEAVSDLLATDYLPQDYDTAKVYFSRYHQSSDWCRSDIKKNIDQGCVITNYFGHGAMGLWGGEVFFDCGDVNSLENPDKYTVLFNWTCLNGFFLAAEKKDSCLAEEFVKSEDKGAVACWAPTGLGYTWTSQILAEGLFGSFFEQGNYILGSAIMESQLYFAQNLWEDDDNLKMFILFGDPALEMGFPPVPDLFPAWVDFNPDLPLVYNPDTISVGIYNSGRFDAQNVLVRFFVEGPDSIKTKIGEKTVLFLSPFDSTVVKDIWEPETTGMHKLLVEVDPDNQIIESNDRNNLYTKVFTVTSISPVHDSLPPEISLFIDGKMVGKDFFEYDFSSSQPEIEAAISDSQGVNMKKIELKINGEEIVDFYKSQDEANPNLVRIFYQPEDLEDGEYQVEVYSEDLSFEKNVSLAKILFLVESKIRLTSAMNYPNPFKDETEFTYLLSKPAKNVEIKVFTLSGKLIRSIKNAPKASNFNSIRWDGKDQDGDEIANGVYIYKIVARGHDGEKNEVIQKIVKIN